MLSLLLYYSIVYTKFCPKFCPLCPGLTIFFSLQHLSYEYIRQNICVPRLGVTNFVFPTLMLQKRLPKYLSLLINWVSRNFVTNIASCTLMSQTFTTNFASPAWVSQGDCYTESAGQSWGQTVSEVCSLGR